MLYDTGLSYRRTAIEGASPIGLVIALYDTLWGDLHRASEAFRTNNIEARCHELNHAFLVLGQLESWVAPENGGDLAESLIHFYRYLRAKMMEASLRQNPKILGELMDLILHVRSAWQQRDTNPVTAVEKPVETQPTATEDLAQDSRRIALSFSA
jgi:flagellar protein FliS